MRATKPTPFLKPGFLAPKGDRPSAASASERPGSTPNVSGKQVATARPKPTFLKRDSGETQGDSLPPAPQRSAQKLHKDEIPLAGYLLAHDAVAGPVTDADLDLLRESDASVREARELLPLGRGNVREDLEATHGLSTYAYACIKDLKEQFPEKAEALALLMEAGVCGDYAALSGLSLAARTSRDVEARVVDQVGVDHLWVEAARNGKYGDRAHTVVLDAWCTGPAVFARDSRFGSATEIKQVRLNKVSHFTKDSHGERLREARSDARGLSNSKPQLPLRSDIKPRPLWDLQSSVDPCFARRARAKLNREVTPKEAYSKMLPTTLDDEPMTVEQERKGISATLRTEIQAVGIACRLAPEMSVVNLVKVAPDIVKAANTLDEAGPSTAVYPFTK